MKVGVLLTFVADYGKSGFYNNQEIGLTKALSRYADEVLVYRAVPVSAQQEEWPVPGCSNAVLKQIPTPSKGINGIWDCSVMDPFLDALIYFSDNQLAVPSVYRWCAQHHVKLFPYIGVIESHSTSAFKRFVMDLLFSRNARVYKKCKCFVKTPGVGAALEKFGIHSVIAPVGIDTSLLKEGYAKADVNALKTKWGFSAEDRILLFIGRMIDEKQPLRMIDIFKALSQKDKHYKLLMVGKGELLEAVKQAAQGLNVQFIEQVPNSEIWELYRIADSFVNLNQQEIFGMAILEAMYYECKVVAWKAPGPNFIIGDGNCGCLCGSNEEIIAAVQNSQIDTAAAHKKIIDKFTWESTSKLIVNVISNNT